METTTPDLTEIFREIIVGEQRLGMPKLPEKRIANIEEFITERFTGEEVPEGVRQALADYLTERIRYWALRRNGERARLWNIVEAEKRLVNAGARKPYVSALERKVTNLLADLKE